MTAGAVELRTASLLITCAVVAGCHRAPPPAAPLAARAAASEAAAPLAPRPPAPAAPAATVTPATTTTTTTTAGTTTTTTTVTAGADVPWLPRRPGRTITTSTSMVILDRIRFVGATAIIDPASRPILDAMASTLAGNPSIRLVEVRAFGPEAGPHAELWLGQQRAQHVTDELIARGVERVRLRPRGAVTPPTQGSAGPEFLIVRRDTDPPSH